MHTRVPAHTCIDTWVFHMYKTVHMPLTKKKAHLWVIKGTDKLGKQEETIYFLNCIETSKSQD